MSFVRHTLNDSHPRSVEKPKRNKSIKTESHYRHVHRNATSGTLTLSLTISGPHSILSPTSPDTIPVLKSLSRIPIPAVAPSQTQVTFNEKVTSRTTPNIDTQEQSSVTNLGLPHGEFYLCTHIIPLYCASRSSPPSSKPCRDFLRTKS